MARAEAFLAAKKDRQLGSQLSLVFIEKADKPAEMVVMPMRENERVDFAWIEGKQGDIVIECLWRVTKINEDVARLRSCLRRYARIDQIRSRWLCQVVDRSARSRSV